MMNRLVASVAQRDQIFLGVVARVASKFQVMASGFTIAPHD